MTLNAAGTKATLNPNALLQARGRYTVKLTSNIKDGPAYALVAKSFAVTIR